jgi:aromatic-L-amino-acid decarboxylase
MSDTIDTIQTEEESLDPKDWDAMRLVGHRMVDDLIARLQTIRDRPVWTPIPAATRAFLKEPLPREPRTPEDVFADVATHVLPYPTGNLHPRFWGWVMGTSSPLAAFAEMMAAGLNWNVGGFDDAASAVEDQVLGWCKQIMGFPADASGLFVSGGSMANLVGLAVGRDARAGVDLRRKGIAAAAARPILYASRETHSSNVKAAELLGLGTEGVRLLPVDADFRLDLRALREAIAADRAAGLHPFAVVGNAGTVNTGATDDLGAIADLCAREGMWFHVDGAFGALARLHPELAPQVAGIERADSLAFDLHKWGYLPVEAGVVLVRDAGAHRGAFAVTSAAYLKPARAGVSARLEKFSDLGVQLSRGFRALKAWMSFREHGSDKLGRLVRQNAAQARYLADLVLRTPALELLAPVPLNVVCFRHRGRPGQDAAAVDELNREILVRLHESGTAVPSGTTVAGRVAIRVAITNHRSRRADFDLLVAAALEAAQGVLDAAPVGA